MNSTDTFFMSVLRCPITRQRLHQKENQLVSEDGGFRYDCDDLGIPYFAEKWCSAEARIQEEHYDKISEKYIENLGYPHTQEYTSYLDDAFFEVLPVRGLGVVAELCCGRGEALRLVGERMDAGIGIDVSKAMLRGGCSDISANKFFFAQGDATMLPLCDAAFDSVIMLGGVHHIPDRAKLFSEISRILKPGGRFYFREPVSDFFVWRWLRALIYRLSPTLDHETENPLRWNETVPPLDSAGLKILTWKTYGLLGFCLFMNSDVLVFNRFFRYIPGVKSVVRLAAKIDDLLVKVPFLQKAGLQVIGIAQKAK